ncbi:MAG: proprotein convertase P-domain-containing protein [Alteromonas sp.]|nr:proprotein convertase P-domain-containing protein [Alteromonas sp.]
MKKITLSILMMACGLLLQAQTVFINEIHYDNAGGDVGEGVEVAGPAGTDLTGWTIEFYNGANGLVYDTLNLSGTIDDEGSGYGALSFLLAGIQNGSPDGLALIDSGSNVIQFLSYEGTMTALGGTANGMMSTDIGVTEGGGTAIGESLQLIGTGNQYADFTWSGPSAESPGDINAGQTFTVPGTPIVPVTATTALPSEFGTDINNTINGNGLDAFPSLTANHGATVPTNSWVTSTLSGTIDYDLGGSYLVDGMSFWNQNGGGPGANGSTGIQGMALYYSTDGISYNPLPGAPTAFAQVPGSGPEAPEMFGWTAIAASFIRLEITSNYGDAFVGYAEIVFSGLPNPAGNPPIISCPMDITVSNDTGVCGAVVNFANAVAIDPDGDLDTVTQTMGPVSGSSFPVGDTLIEFTATDMAGNSSSCTFTITVEDNEAPVIACMDVTVELDASGAYTLDTTEVLASATDNCGVDSQGFLVPTPPIVSCGNAPESIPAGAPGTTSGPMNPSIANVTDTGIIGADVTIDNVILNIEHSWAADLDIFITSPSGTSLELSTDNGGSTGLDTAADVVFTDASGNAITGWTGGAPLADYQAEGGLMNTLFAGEDINGNWTLTITDDAGGDFGVLNSFCISFSGLAQVTTLDLGCMDVGTNAVTVYVSDAAGNTATCTANVTVEDNTAPVISCIGEATGPSVFINELHYDNTGADQDEAIEIAGPAGTDLSTYSLVLYNGNGGAQYDELMLSGSIDDEGSGYGAVNFPIAGIQNGSPDGIVLARNGEVIQFLSYEGSFTAIDGIAAGLTSTDIGVSEAGSTPIGESLQLTGNGTFYPDFTWTGPLTSSPGDLNAGQTFVAPPSSLLVELDANGQASIDASQLITGVDEACGYTITVGNPAPPSNACATNLPAAIDENLPPTEAPASIADSGIIGVDYVLDQVSLDITHTFDGDLDIELISPAGTVLLLSDQNGGGGDNYTGTIFQDGGADITAGTAPFTGIFAPQGGSFAATYDGEDINGDWTLRVTDNFGGDQGTLDTFCINFEPLISSTLNLDCSNLGENQIEVTVTDDSGNAATCTATVEVVDVTDPILVCQDVTIVLDENGMAEINPEDLLATAPSTYEAMVIGSDNQSGTEGFTDFTAPVTDAASISFDWVYTSNDTDPGFDSFGYLLNGVYTQLTNPALGNQSGSAGPINVSPGDVFGFRSQTDDNIFGNNETVVSNFAPGFSGQFEPANWTLNLTNSDGDAFFVEIPGGPLSYDACGITILAVDITDVTCADIGTPIVVTVFASDASGNLASCTSIVTVVDESGPTLECPGDMTVDPGANNLFYELPDYWGEGQATATDNCTDPVTVFSQDPAAGTLVPDGVYTITLCAEDEYGNESCCTFELTVESVLGVDHNSLDSGVAIYPNPAASTVNIANASSILLDRAAIYDVNGKLVQTIDLSNMDRVRPVDVSGLASGVYLVQIQGEGQQTVKRLVKE